MVVIEAVEDKVIEWLTQVLVDPKSATRETIQTQTFNGNGTNKVFTLLNTAWSGGVLRCINTVTVDGTVLKKHDDYTINKSTREVTCDTAPSNDTSNVVISLDYGTNFVHRYKQDFKLTVSTMPVVLVGRIDSNYENAGMSSSDTKGTVEVQADFITSRDNVEGIIDSVTLSNDPLVHYWTQDSRKKIKNNRISRELGSNIRFLNMSDAPVANLEEDIQACRRTLRITFIGENLDENQ